MRADPTFFAPVVNLLAVNRWPAIKSVNLRPRRRFVSGICLFSASNRWACRPPLEIFILVTSDVSRLAKMTTRAVLRRPPLDGSTAADGNDYGGSLETTRGLWRCAGRGFFLFMPLAFTFLLFKLVYGQEEREWVTIGALNADTAEAKNNRISRPTGCAVILQSMAGTERPPSIAGRQIVTPSAARGTLSLSRAVADFVARCR